ncbi:MAG: PRC-barrel domain-containing protein [Longimicrobiaceae bacterium]
MMNDDLDRVVPLDQLDDYKVAEGDPDVRGWEVVASDGRKIGEVDQLLVDTAAMKVRYLDVDVDNDLVAGATDASDRHVLIPIGYARLDEGSDRVIVDQLASSDVVGLPEYTHGPITRDFESSVRSRFDAGYTAGGTAATAGASGLASTESTETTRDTDFYSHDLYDDNRFYGARRTLDSSESPPPLSGTDRSLGEQRLGGAASGSDSSLDTGSSMRSDSSLNAGSSMRSGSSLDTDSSLRGDSPLHSGTSLNSDPSLRGDSPLGGDPSLRGDSSLSEDPLLRGSSSTGGAAPLHSDTRGEDDRLRDERRDDRL